MIELVAFYRDLSKTAVGTSPDLLKRVGQFNYVAALTLLSHSLKHWHPNDSRFVVQTDWETRLDFDNLFRTNLAPYNLMESFIIANIDYVQNNTGDLILSGADHLVCGSFAPLFSEDFDLATVTYGGDYPPGGSFSIDHRTNVINIFFMRVNHKNRERIISFLLRRYEIYKSFSQSDRVWWGDQKSLSVLLETEGILTEHFDSNRQKCDFQMMGLKIKLLPYGGDYIIGIAGKNNDWSNVEGIVHTKDTACILDFAGEMHIKAYFLDAYKKIALRNHLTNVDYLK